MREGEVEGSSRIIYVVCEPLERAGFLNAFSTRQGGAGLRGELNLGGGPKEEIAENRRRFLKAIGAEGMTLITMRQTHSSEVSIVEAGTSNPTCDAMIAKDAGLLLAVQTADCLPILIANPEVGLVAAIHAGWRGTAQRITERTVAAIRLRFGADARTSMAALGPSICASCYQVREDVIERYRKEFRYWEDLFLQVDGRTYLDIRAANVRQLLLCGFAEDRIYVAEHCTMHQRELFFSYRRESKFDRVGRMLSVIGRPR
jgi:YfiH family protein